MTQPVSATVTVAVRHIGAYLDLLQSDLDSGIALARSRLMAACVTAAALLMAITLLCGWIVAEAWNTPQRSRVVGALLAALFAIAAIAFWRLRALRSAPRLLSQTRRELSKDGIMLIDFLERDKELQR